VTSNDAVTSWVAQQLLKVTRTTVTTQLMSGAWPILGLSMHSPEIEVQAMQAANTELADYGISITRLGNVDVNLDDDDNARLKKLAGDTAYSRLAGGFLQAAQAEAMQGAGEGMAQGGAAVTPMFLGAGFGMANQMMQAPGQAPAAPPLPPGTGFAGGGQGYVQQQPPQQAPQQQAPQQQAAPPQQQAAPAPAPAGTVECGNCHGQVQAGAKFCAECGTPMQKHCTNCNASLSGTAKFCAECGTPAGPPAS
jgi:membrane protease subunit (stomatin/prohibitin family)